MKLVPADVWERCKPLIEAALKHDPQGTKIEDVERSIASGESILLAGANSAMVLKVVETKSLHVHLAGGELQEIKSSEMQLAELAKAFDCTQITIMGRKGWERALRDLGYQPLVMKDVSNGQ